MKRRDFLKFAVGAPMAAPVLAAAASRMALEPTLAETMADIEAMFAEGVAGDLAKFPFSPEGISGSTGNRGATGLRRTEIRRFASDEIFAAFGSVEDQMREHDLFDDDEELEAEYENENNSAEDFG